jgi:putative MFS transporter
MLILTGVLVLGAVVSIMWAPETKDMTLVGASSVKPLIAH